MSRIIPIKWNRLECVIKKAGFVFSREKGSHLVYTKEGVSRPVVIPKYDPVGMDIIHSVIKTAGLSREEYLKLLDDC